MDFGGFGWILDGCYMDLDGFYMDLDGFYMDLDGFQVRSWIDG